MSEHRQRCEVDLPEFARADQSIEAGHKALRNHGTVRPPYALAAGDDIRADAALAEDSIAVGRLREEALQFVAGLLAGLKKGWMFRHVQKGRGPIVGEADDQGKPQRIANRPGEWRGNQRRGVRCSPSADDSEDSLALIYAKDAAPISRASFSGLEVGRR